MEMESGRSRPDREALVSLHPSSDGFPIARHLDTETREKFLGFSEPAKATTYHWILDYAKKVIDASFTVKQNVAGDNVSEANVNEAAYGLNRKEGKSLTKLAGIIGGIFLGTSISTLVSLVQAAKFDRSGTIFMAVSGILGAFLIALELRQGILPKWRKRTSSSPAQPVRVRRRPGNQASRAPKE